MKKQHITVCTKSMENVINECKEWAKEIEQVYRPDLIVFIAKSGFLFAKPMAEYFGCAMADITASRPASKVKDKSKKIIDVIPEKIILKILKSSLMYRFHQTENMRNLELTDRYRYEEAKEHKNILILDDSVDTGWTLKNVQEEVKKSFPNSTIKTAGYAVIGYSKKIVAVDFYKYENAIILTATSRKSNQYEEFLDLYREWIEDSDV